MIEVHGIVSWPGTPVPACVRLGGRHRLEIPVRSVERAARFYSRVFGFRPIVRSNGQSATFAVAANAEAVLVAATMPAEQGSDSGSWGFLVADLEAAREEAWNLGVRVAGDSGAPDQIRRRGNVRMLPVQDRDGNVIRLVEVARSHAVAPASTLGRQQARYAPGSFSLLGAGAFDRPDRENHACGC